MVCNIGYFFSFLLILILRLRTAAPTLLLSFSHNFRHRCHHVDDASRVLSRTTGTRSPRVPIVRRIPSSHSSLILEEEPAPTQNKTVFESNDHVQDEPPSRRRRLPYEQRVSGPRKARRLNHSFQHLYRHSDPSALSEKQQQTLNYDVRRYLKECGGYTDEEVDQMSIEFPPLLELDVGRHLRPKMKFLKRTLGGGTAAASTHHQNFNQDFNETSNEGLLARQLKQQLPANYYGSRLERTIAPRHAFLMHSGLPHGPDLWQELGTTIAPSKTEAKTPSLLREFLLRHRQPKQFAALCNAWKDRYGISSPAITPDQIVAFDKLFQRGILSAARNDTGYVFPDETKDDKRNGRCNGKRNDNRALTQIANVTSSQLIRYLISHGANPYETDVRGASLFHWAAGCGNLDGLRELVRCCNAAATASDTVNAKSNPMATTHGKPPNTNRPGSRAALSWKASRDDATPLHWAAAGAGPKEFGIGGHANTCAYLLSLCEDDALPDIRTAVNARTKDGNTVLMWAAWSGSLSTVKLLVRHRADATISNQNGCTVAHWAASGGDVDVCRYLHSVVGVDFTVANRAGNTPLSHAVAYGRSEVVRWFRDEVDGGGVDEAEGLAMEFVQWADMGLGMSSEEEKERRKVFDLFRDWSEEMGEECNEHP